MDIGKTEEIRSRHGGTLLSLAGRREAFADLWDEINGKCPGCSWAANPWTWCVSYHREPNP